MARRMLSIAVVALLAVVATGCASLLPVRTTTVESVDIPRYMGLWYEVASVKQFFSIGLVGTTATYTLRDDGVVEVVNQGRYFSPKGPPSIVRGTAVPVDSSGARLNVSFSGTNSASPPGNYWIVALDPDYQWAVVSNPSGTACFILSRAPAISAELRAELLEAASAARVDVSNVTDTPQP